MQAVHAAHCVNAGPCVQAVHFDQAVHAVKHMRAEYRVYSVRCVHAVQTLTQTLTQHNLTPTLILNTSP